MSIAALRFGGARRRDDATTASPWWPSSGGSSTASDVVDLYDDDDDDDGTDVHGLERKRDESDSDSDSESDLVGGDGDGVASETATSTTSSKDVHELLPKVLRSFRDVETAAAMAETLASEYLFLRKRRDITPIAVFDIDDTLLADKAIAAIVSLLLNLRKLGLKILLVTARLDTPEVRTWTERQLTSLGIERTRDYDALVIASAEDRKTPTHIGLFKDAARRNFAAAQRGLVVLTVGDQWTDLVAIRNDAELHELDRAMRVVDKRAFKYHLVRLVRHRDECRLDPTTQRVTCAGLWGLKLKTADEGI